MSEERVPYLTPATEMVKHILKEDRKVIVYRPSWREITGAVNATILLQQVKFRWESNGNKPFYKFFAPCQHKAYKTGDSWQEELGFSRKELQGALNAIAKRLTRADMDDFVNALQGHFFGYYRDRQHLTWHYFNENYFLSRMVEHYSNSPHPKRGCGESPKGDVATSQKGISINTETTTEKTHIYMQPQKIFGSDPLSDIIKGQDQTSEVTATNPYDAHFGTNRDPALRAFEERLERKPNQVEKQEIIDLSQEPSFSLEKWDYALKEAVLNWTGRHTVPFKRVVNVYRSDGDYQKAMAKEFPNSASKSTELEKREYIPYYMMPGGTY